MQSYSKDSIKDQMIRTAAREWDIAENEIDANFDPLVGLLMEACAAELEKIGHRINDSHHRMTEKLSEFLVPDAAGSALPSSAIATALPSGSKGQINHLSTFVLENKNAENIPKGKAGPTEIFLAPVGEFTVLDCTTPYQLCGNAFYKLTPGKRRELLHAQPGQQSDTICLALQVAEECNNLEGLQIFIQIRSNVYQSAFYNALPQAVCAVGNNQIDFSIGYANGDQFEVSPTTVIKSGYGYLEKIKRQVANAYQNQFISLGKVPVVAENDLPSYLQYLPEPIQQSLKKERLTYLLIKLPQFFPQEILDGINCQLNAFPVINIQLSQIQYKTQPWINIIPMPAKGLFLDIESITSSAGNNYHFRYTAERTQPEEGEAVLRKRGVGILSGAEIKETTENLMESIRDQQAYFSEVRNETIVGRLREILIILNRTINEMTGKGEDLQAATYLMVRPVSEGDMLTIEYYSTYGTDGQVGRVNDVIRSNKHTITRPGTEMLVSPLIGARDDLNPQEKTLVFKRQLLSRGSIVSAEDVKLLCAQIFGNRMAAVKVARDTVMSSKRNEGFKRAIAVQISLQNNHGLSMEEIDLLKKEVAFELASHATIGLPFEISVV